MESGDSLKEENYIFSKAYICPVCNGKFHSMTVRTGKARLIGSDKDLRNIFKGVDANKYDVVLCNHCGYAALLRYFGPLAKPHRDMIVENIARKFKPVDEKLGVISYEEAFIRYKMAQISAFHRQAKNSEKAYICLKTAWLLRGMREELVQSDEFSTQKVGELETQEKKYLEAALAGFEEARMSEMPPIAGMNEITLDYLLSVLCLECEKYEDGLKLAQNVVVSGQATSQQKEKAREIVAELKALLKSE